MLCHNSLENYYKTNFSLMQHHKYSITEIEGMIPFERDIYVKMLSDYIRHIEEQQELAKQR